MGGDRQQQFSAWLQVFAKRFQDADVIRKMLEHVEQADQMKGMRKLESVDVAGDERATHALPGVMQALVIQLHAHDLAAAANLFEDAQHIARPAADFEDAVTRRHVRYELADNASQHLVASTKPEMPILGLKQTGKCSLGVVGQAMRRNHSIHA